MAFQIENNVGSKAAVATSRRSHHPNSSDAGVYADWTPPADKITTNDLSLAFNAPAPPHHHHPPLWPSSSAAAFNAGVYVTSFHHHDHPPSLTPSDPSHSFNAPDLTDSRSRPFWQNQQPPYTTINFDHGGSSGGGPTVSCQDCGNQAKKDCTHRRCRTCCRSRGFDCATHVKSTWVSATRRRERHAAGASSGSTSGTKKPRLVGVANSQNTPTTSHTSNSNTPPRSFDTGSSHQDGGFRESMPGQVRAPAVFKCVRVTALDDGNDDEYAYQAVVKIGGHVFKGFLYDQGSHPAVDAFPNLSDLHLGGAANAASSSSPLLDPSQVYGGGFPGNTMN